MYEGGESMVDYKKLVVEHYCPKCDLDDIGNLYVIFENESGSKFKKEHGLERSSAFYRYLVLNNFPDLGIKIVTKIEFHKINAKRRKGSKKTEEQLSRMLESQRQSGIKERKKWFDEIDREAEKN